MSRLRALDALFRELFDGPDLRRFARLGPDGESIVENLPGPPASEADISFALAVAFDQRGLIDARFFQTLAEQRPHCLDRIRTTAERCGVPFEGLDRSADDDAPRRLLHQLGAAHAQAIVALGSAICDRVSKPPPRRARQRRRAAPIAEPLFVQLEEVFGVHLSPPAEPLSPPAMAPHFAARIPAQAPRDDLRLHLFLLGIEATRLLQVQGALRLGPGGVPLGQLDAQLADASKGVKRVLDHLSAFAALPSLPTGEELVTEVPGLAPLARTPKVDPDQVASSLVSWMLHPN